MSDDNTELKSPTISISLKTVGSVISGIVAILGSIWALDSHYASAADVDRLQRGFESQVRQLRQERAEDELLKLSVKKQIQGGKLDPVDTALHERYTRRINDTQKEEKEAVALEKANKK
jgi:hypothetical protein